MSLLSASFFLLLRSAKSATVKFIEIISLANYAFFHVHVIQIYFESEYSKKRWILALNTAGFNSTGFDISLYASPVVSQMQIIS